MKLNDGDLLDLERLVSRLRQLTEERSRIPIHSGRATSDIRRANRARRRELTEEIYKVEREIISWALAVVPVRERWDDQPREDSGGVIPSTEVFI